MCKYEEKWLYIYKENMIREKEFENTEPLGDSYWSTECTSRGMIEGRENIHKIENVLLNTCDMNVNIK